MKIIKHFFLLFSFLVIAQTAKACKLSTVTIETCYSSVQWKTWNDNDYKQVKQICGNLPISLDIGCPGSLLHDTDEVCVYEVDEDGNENLVYCSNYSDLDFTPEEGKKYKIQVSRGGSIDFEVTFESVNCEPSIEVSQNNNSCLRTGQPINFEVNLNSNNKAWCFDYVWEFGDGNSGSGNSASHSYCFSASPSNPCRTFTVKLKMISNCEECPDFEITKMITVCRYCPEIVVNHDNDFCSVPTKLKVVPNPTRGPIIVHIDYKEGIPLKYLTISRIWDGETVLIEELSKDLIFPLEYEFDLSPYPSGLYKVAIIAEDGEMQHASVMKE